MCLSMAVIFALCSYDCSRPLLSCRQLSVLDCCDLVLCFVVVVFFLFFFVFGGGGGGFHLMLACRQPSGVLRWLQLFCFFHLMSAVCLPD